MSNRNGEHLTDFTLENVLYTHVPYHNVTIIKTHAGITDAMIKTQEDFCIKYLPLSLLQGFEKVVCGFTVRGSWRPNITEIFWPQSYGRQRCVFLVLQGCSTRALESTLQGAGFPYYFSSTPVSNSTRLYCLLINSSALYYLQTPTWWYGHASAPPQFLPISGDRDVSLPLSLEWPAWSSSSGKTVMQFRGQSLPVGRSVRV